ncbi:carbonic anhydrase family protein, partial [Pseudomonas fluorescens]
YLAQKRASQKGQYPSAVILSCIDSRAPAEILLDAGIGETFNCRVAGNVENEDILGSMEFACALAGAKVIVVMGHTSCGAVKGAIANAELGNLTGLLSKIKPAITETAYAGERTADNYDFVDSVARTNIKMTLADIRQHSPTLNKLEQDGKIKIVGAIYKLVGGEVEFFT